MKLKVGSQLAELAESAGRDAVITVLLRLRTVCSGTPKEYVVTCRVDFIAKGGSCCNTKTLRKMYD